MQFDCIAIKCMEFTKLKIWWICLKNHSVWIVNTNYYRHGRHDVSISPYCFN